MYMRVLPKNFNRVGDDLPQTEHPKGILNIKTFEKKEVLTAVIASS